MSAFHGDAATRDRIVAGMRQAIASQAFLPDADADMPGRTDLLVAVIGTSDVDVFEGETGYPGSLGLLANQSIQRIAGDRRADARQIALDWFAAVTPGTDLLPAAARFAIWLLNEEIRFAESTPELLGAAKTVRQLQDRFARGDHPGRAEWSAARKHALEIADHAAIEGGRAVAELIAGLAWPVDRSRNILAENAKLLCEFKAQRIVASSGWSKARRDACAVRMQEIWCELAARLGREPLPPEFRRCFEECHADLAEPFTAALQTENQAFSDSALACAKRALSLMADRCDSV